VLSVRILVRGERRDFGLDEGQEGAVMRLLLQRLRATKSTEGFTLIELLVVIIILGILAGIVVFGVAKFRENSELAACKADLKTVQVATEAFYAAEGTYPASVSELKTNGYLKDEPPASEGISTSGGTVSSTKC
jgi:prepilin-type N-terminal cleavage/methylation domain-containing protein